MKKKLTNSDLSYFCGQLSMIIRAGISSIEGLYMMGDDIDASDAEKKLYADLRKGVEEDGFLHIAMEKSGLFPPYMVKMTRIGEETGTLDNVLESLGKHYAREEEIRQSIRQAVTYPIVMSAMILVVILVLLLEVMPVFRQVFRQLGTEMSGFAGLLFQIGDMIRQYSTVCIVVLVVLLIPVLICVRTAAGRRVGMAFLSNFSFFRKLKNDISVSRFADGLSLTLHSGFSPDFGVEMVSEIIEDKAFKGKMQECRRHLTEGAPFDQALKKSQILSGVDARMMAIGHRTGSADTVMEQISDMSQKRIDARISSALGTIEPVLVLLLSVIIGAVLMSVMFPLLGIVSSI
ncbi:MAG: type II secretion system F family protein [Lachnospiraceae bacterium]|nr:type II secretion system F family protein [Lachnospiraceae bacterium]